MENIRYGRLDATDEEVIEQQRQLMQTALSCSSLAVTTWYWMKKQVIFLRDRNSFLLLQEQFLQTQDPDP